MDNFFNSHRCTSSATLVRGASVLITPTCPATLVFSCASCTSSCFLCPNNARPCISVLPSNQLQTKAARSFPPKIGSAAWESFLHASSDKGFRFQCQESWQFDASNMSSSRESNTLFGLSSRKVEPYRHCSRQHDILPRHGNRTIGDGFRTNGATRALSRSSHRDSRVSGGRLGKVKANVM